MSDTISLRSIERILAVLGSNSFSVPGYRLFLFGVRWGERRLEARPLRHGLFLSSTARVLIRRAFAVAALTFCTSCADVYMSGHESFMPPVSNPQTQAWARDIRSEFATTQFKLILPPEDSRAKYWQPVLSFVQISDVQLRDHAIRYKDRLVSKISQRLFFHGTEREEDADLHAEYPFITLAGAIRDSATKPAFLIHTGDSAEVPTIGELYRFIGVANLLDIPWLNVVGNHDILLFGNFNQRGYTIKGGTPDVIPITGRDAYVKAHNDWDLARSASTNLFGPHAITARGLAPVPPLKAHGFDDKSGVAWYSVRLATDPPLRLIALDTIPSDEYIGTFGSAQVPGVGAESHLPEVEVDWLKRELGEASAAGEAVLVFGHHPMTFANKDRILVQPSSASAPISLRDELGRYPNVLGYFGGHTHAADVAARITASGKNLVEVTAPSMREFPFFGFWIDVLKNADGEIAIQVRPLQSTVDERPTQPPSNFTRTLALACKGAADMAGTKPPCALTSDQKSKYSQFFVVGQLPSPYPQVKVVRQDAVCEGDEAKVVLSLSGTAPWHIKTQPPIPDVALTDKNAQILIAPGQPFTIESVSDARHPDVPVNDAKLFVQSKPLPAGAIGGPDEICEGATATLSAPHGSKYEWSNGATSPEIALKPQGQTEISVKVTGSNDCTASFEKTINVISPAAATINGAAAPTVDICPGASLTLTTGPAAEILWIGPGVDRAKEHAATLVISHPRDGDEYAVVVKDSHGCTTHTSTVVRVLSPLSGEIEGPSAVCEGEAVKLTAPTAAAFAWNTADTTRSVNVKPSAPSTTYTVDATGAKGCVTRFEHVVNVWRKPTASVQASEIRDCAGLDKIIKIDLTGTPPWSLSWRDGYVQDDIFTSPAIRHVSIGTSDVEYSLMRVSDHHACEGLGEGSVRIAAAGAPSLQVTSSPGETDARLKLTATGAAAYKWSTGQAGPTITVPKESGRRYTVTGTADNGCEAVLEYIVPN
jgi:hypothetical protein